ncbi:MAG: glycosyltransferase family 4 protein [Bacteroidetes bacterium]|nr:glycosyltransferase family 4 protein [Bacteroidota bacterium]
MAKQQFPFRILHLLTSQSFGGLEMYVCSLINKLQMLGIENVLYCMPNSKVEKTAASLGIKTVHSKRSGTYISISDIKKVRSLSHSKTIIHSHSRYNVWLGSLSAYFTKTPHVLSVYMNAVPKKDLLHRMIYRRVDAIQSTSSLTNNQIKDFFHVNPAHIYRVPYGRDVELLRIGDSLRNQIRDKFNTSDKIVFGMMCRIDEQKGIREFVEAFMLLSNELRDKVQFWIFGEPSISSLNEDGTPIYEKEGEDLQIWLKSTLQIIDKNEDSFRVFGFQNEYSGYLAAMDVFVLASHCEMYSLSVIEAMILGKPIIGTNCGGTIEQIGDNQRGLLFTPKNAHQLSEAITEYIKYPEMRKNHGESARHWAEKEHSWNISLESQIKIYQKLIS